MPVSEASPDSYFEPYYEAMLELSSPRTDWKRYVELLERAASAGDDHAAYALSSMYLHGFDKVAWKTDPRRGLRLLQKASRSVHLAMVELASIYEAGDFGCRKNTKRAFALFSRGVIYGSVVARYHAGRCIYYGIGTRPDPRSGMRLIRSAARLGFPIPP